MPNLLPIQHSFDAGELSPRFLARSDLAIYSRGASYMLNVLCTEQGPFIGRAGSTYVGDVKGTQGRIFGFQETWKDGYEIAISDDGRIYVTDSIQTIIGGEIIQNGDFTSGLLGWTDNSGKHGVVSVTDGILSMLTENRSDGQAEIYQEVETTADPTSEHSVIVQMFDPGVSFELRIGTTPGALDILQVVTGGTLIATTFIPLVDTFWVTLFRNGNTDSTKRIDSVSVRPLLGVTSADISSFSHPWTNNLEYIHAKMPPGDDKMYFTHPNVAPYVLEHIGEGEWSFGAVPFTGQPAAWADDHWPRCLAFFQGRSWWGGPNETFYASKSGEPLDLTPGVNDADGIEFTIAKRGEIVWIEGLRNLILGTRTTEHIITSQSGIITPTDIDVEQQSAYGSNHCQPIQLGNKAAYVTGDGRKIQAIGYQWTEEQWLSDDLTFSAEHLTQFSEIDELLWAQNPTKTIGVKLRDGTALTCLYDPAKQIIGWARFNTNGFMHSLDKLDFEGTSFFIALISRGTQDESGNPLMFLEIFGASSFLDASKTEFSETPKDTIDDGEYFAGKEVSVKIDDAIHPSVVLDENGQAILEWSGSTIVYGLPYTQQSILMPRDFPFEGGSTTSMKKRWNKIWVRLLNSVLPEINGVRPPDRYPQTPMDTREPLTVGDVKVANLGYDDGSINIVNDLPYPLRVAGVFGEMGAEKI